MYLFCCSSTWKNCSCFSRLQKKGCLSILSADGLFSGSTLSICSIRFMATTPSAKAQVHLLMQSLNTICIVKRTRGCLKNTEFILIDLKSFLLILMNKDNGGAQEVIRHTMLVGLQVV